MIFTFETFLITSCSIIKDLLFQSFKGVHDSDIENAIRTDDRLIAIPSSLNFLCAVIVVL